MNTYAYARVSTQEQNLESQVEILKSKYPEAKIFTEKASGATIEDRPVFMMLFEDVLRKGDTVVFLKVDRLSRCVEDIQYVHGVLRKRGVIIKFDDVDYDINDPLLGGLFLSILAMGAQMERRNILYNQRRGVESAKKKRAFKGSYVNKEKWDTVRKFLSEGHTAQNTAKLSDVARAFVYRVINYDKAVLERNKHVKTMRSVLKNYENDEIPSMQALEKETKIPRELIREIVDELRPPVS